MLSYDNEVSDEEYDTLEYEDDEDGCELDVENAFEYQKPRDIEMGVYQTLSVDQAKEVLEKDVKDLSELMDIDASISKRLLHLQKWSIPDLSEKYYQDKDRFLKSSQVSISTSKPHSTKVSSKYYNECQCCFEKKKFSEFSQWSCGHLFCKTCWRTHIDTQITRGNVIKSECMAKGCDIVLLEKFVLEHVSPALKDRYINFSTLAYMDSHPFLKRCPGTDCSSVFRVWEVSTMKLECTSCLLKFCFSCSSEYHLPIDCETNHNWLEKCKDDSETAHYLAANTRTCPKCKVNIERSVGCNHMTCINCQHEFCWLCQAEWIKRTLAGTHTYRCAKNCSTYDQKESTLVSEDVKLARTSLKRYMFYFERWANHDNCQKLEAQALTKAMQDISVKAKNFEYLASDWKFLEEAYQALAAARYTMKYTYPYVFYTESLSRKELVEHQQAVVEEHVERLASMLQNPDLTTKPSVMSFMHSLERQRITLLQQFLKET